MEKTDLIAKAKALIAEGTTEKAIQLVEQFLAKKPLYSKLHDEALSLSSQFFKTKKEQAKNVISFENAEISYGKVREGLLDLLGYIDKDDLNPSELTKADSDVKSNSPVNKWLLIIGVPLVILSLAVLILVKKLGGEGSESTKSCEVQFENTVGKNFLIMPFYKPDGSDSQIEGLFTGRLEDFCAKIESLKNSSFQQCDGFEPKKLLSFEEATEIGNKNKATLVLWGLTEKGNGTTFVKTRFKYLGGKDENGKVPFTRLSQNDISLQGEQSVSTDKVLSIVTSSGELTQNIESTLMLMFGMIANLEGDREGAIDAMNYAVLASEDTTAHLLKYMVLADNYIASGEPQKALAALDTCLDVNKKYWLGRNNRANLRIETGDYLGAIEDLTVALAKQPDDVEMLTSRGIAYKNSQQLYAAKQDFEKVVKLAPKTEPQMRKTIDETDVEIKRLEKIIEPTKVNIETKKVSKQQVINAAIASNKLGDLTTTKKLVAKGLEIDKDNPSLIAVQADNLLKQNQPEKAKEVLKEAIKRNVKKEDIAKHSTNIAMLLKDMSFKKEIEK